jgi:hypothetical protein
LKTHIQGRSITLLLKNVGDKWEKLNAAVEKKDGVRCFGVEEY